MRLLLFIEDEAWKQGLLHAARPEGLEWSFADSDDELARTLSAGRYEAVLARKGARDLALARLRQTLGKHAPGARLYLLGLAHGAGADPQLVGLGEATPTEVLRRLAADYALRFPEASEWDLIEPLCERGSWAAHYARSYRTGKEGVLTTLAQGLCDDDQQAIRDRLEPILEVRHPNLAPAMRVDLAADPPAILWEVPGDGVTLRALQQKLGGKTSPDLALAIVDQVAAGLGALHTRGLRHGWFDSDAVWVAPSGDVRLLHAGVGALGEAIRQGTRGGPRSVPAQHWLSPEELAEKIVGAPADVFRAGVLAFALIEGRFPFARGSPFEELQATLGEPAPLVDAPPRMAEAVGRALAKDPGARPEDGRALQKTIESARASGWPGMFRRPKEPRQAVAEAWAKVR